MTLKKWVNPIIFGNDHHFSNQVISLFGEYGWMPGVSMRILEACDYVYSDSLQQGIRANRILRPFETLEFRLARRTIVWFSSQPGGLC